MVVSTTPQTASSVQPAVLWYTRCPVPTASSIAIQNGWLEKEFGKDGIQVNSLRKSDQRSVHESHFSHTQPSSFRQGGNIPPIWSRSQGSDTRLIGLSWVDQSQAIIALPESKIRTVKDLQGRRLGLPKRLNDQIDFWRATSLRAFLSALALKGLNETDVEFVDLPVEETYISKLNQSVAGALFTARQAKRLQAAEAIALIRGEVDAIYARGGPGAELQAFLDAHVVIDLSYHPDPVVSINNNTPVALTVSGALAEEHPDVVARYVTQLLKAAQWSANHRSEAVRIFAQEIGTAEEWIDTAYDPKLHEKLAPELSEQSIQAITNQKDFLLKWGFIQHDIDIREWIDSRPLETALQLIA